MRIKFLFINAIDQTKAIETRYPPLGIGYLCSSLRKKFPHDEFEFRIIFNNAEQEIIDFKPNIVGISAVSQNYNRAIRYAAMAKKYGLTVLCGGVHISMLPSSLTKDMDIGVVGEGEETLCDLIELFLSAGSFPCERLGTIPGLVYWDKDGILRTTAKRQLISPLDKIPLPARDLLEIHPDTYMFTSRGCPYRCAFCASSRFWDKVRFFSAEYVAEEIAQLVERYKVRSINLYDDLFALDAQRVKKIIELLGARGILGKVEFSCATRADLVNDEVAVLLRELGVRSVAMGLESGCRESIRYLKQNVSIEDNERAVGIFRKHGILVFASFIIGSPQEKREDILKTLKFIKRSGLSGFSIYLLTPFPGTPVWDYAYSRGLVSEDMDWDKLDVDFERNHDSAIILSERLSRAQLYGLFLGFRQYGRMRDRLNYLKQCMRNPAKLFSYLKRKFFLGGRRDDKQP